MLSLRFLNHNKKLASFYQIFIFIRNIIKEPNILIKWQNNTKIVLIVKNIGHYIVLVRLIPEWWAIQGSNLWLSARQADTLPLS